MIFFLPTLSVVDLMLIKRHSFWRFTQASVILLLRTSPGTRRFLGAGLGCVSSSQSINSSLETELSWSARGRTDFTCTHLGQVSSNN